MAATREGLIRGVYGVVPIALGQDEHRNQIAAEDVEAVRASVAEGYSLVAVVPQSDGSIELGLPGATSRVKGIRIEKKRAALRRPIEAERRARVIAFDGTGAEGRRDCVRRG